MHPDAAPPRRTVVAAGVVALTGAGTLAACGSGDSGGSGTAGGGSSASGASSPAAAAGESLVKLADVPVGGAVTAKGGTVIVAQPTAGQVVAFSAICPHQGCKVAPAGATLNCPCHASRFETATGKVLNGPAKKDLSPVAVKVSGQDVVAG